MAGTDTTDKQAAAVAAATKPYELLDSGTNINGRMVKFGAMVQLTDDQAEFLERYGSVRPWGENDHDLVDDERDLPGILASAKGREDLARLRIAKRGGDKDEEQQETSPAREQLAQLTETRTGPDPVLAPTADQERPEQVQPEQRDDDTGTGADTAEPSSRRRERGQRGTAQEQSPGRRG